MNQIGDAIRKARTNAELTQQEMADNLGISLWTYNRLENGKRTFDTEWLAKLPYGMRPTIAAVLSARYRAQLDIIGAASQRPRVGFTRGPRAEPQTAVA